MQALVISTQHEQARVGNHDRGIQDMAGYRACRDAVELALVATGPDLGAQQAQGYGDQAMIEVSEHDIITPTRQVVVKYDGPLEPGMGMFQAIGTPGPASTQFWDIKDFDGWIVTIRIVQGTPL